CRKPGRCGWVMMRGVSLSIRRCLGLRFPMTAGLSCCGEFEQFFAARAYPLLAVVEVNHGPAPRDVELDDGALDPVAFAFFGQEAAELDTVTGTHRAQPVDLRALALRVMQIALQQPVEVDDEPRHGHSRNVHPI